MEGEGGLSGHGGIVGTAYDRQVCDLIQPSAGRSSHTRGRGQGASCPPNQSVPAADPKRRRHRRGGAHQAALAAREYGRTAIPRATPLFLLCFIEGERVAGVKVICISFESRDVKGVASGEPGNRPQPRDVAKTDVRSR
jgi:hypothetical protein